MKRFIWLLLFSLSAFAQVSTPGVRYVATAPSGSCAAAPPIQVVASTGVGYTCNNGTWGAIGSSGTGTVTSVGTTGPITGGTITSTGTIACPSCVVSSSPGVGLAHFAGSTQTVTSSGVAIADLTATGTPSSTTYLRGDNTWSAVSGGGAWSGLANATAGLTLANAGFASTFNQTSAVNWTWANTTAATSGVNQSSPIFNLCGQAWEGGTPGDTQDCVTAQQTFPGANPNPTPVFVVGDAGTGSSRLPSGTWFGVNMYYDPSHLALNLGGARPVTDTANYQLAVGDGSLAGGGGAGDIGIGHQALTNDTSGNDNLAIGYVAGNACTTCIGNVALGFGANIGSGADYSVAIGDGAATGNFVGTVIIGNSLTGTGNYVIDIGYGNTTVGANDDVIGQGITATAANQVWLGNSSITNTFLQGIVSAPAYATATNCSSSASPAVCGSAAAGSVALPTNAVSSSIVVNTTAVTANSQILISTDDTLGTKLGVTCNSTVATLVGGLTISARTAGTSFTIANNVAVVTNPLCVSYVVIN